MSTDQKNKKNRAELRAVPHSAEAEQALLGSILLAPHMVLDTVSDRLAPEHMYIPAHQIMYAGALKMHEAGAPIDLITYTQFLRDADQLENVGGASFVTSVFNFVPTAANFEYYLDIVRRKFIRRQIIESGTELVRRAYEESDDEFALLDNAQATITALSEESLKETPVRQIADDVQEAMDYADTVYKKRGKQVVHGMATGFNDFDRMTGGLLGGQFVVLAGRPAMGKTAIGMNIVEYVATQLKLPVLVFSLEMSRPQLVRRLLMSRAGVSLHRLRDGFFSEANFTDLTTAGIALRQAPIYLDETPALRIDTFKARARRARSQLRIGLIVIDYIQLMKSPSKRAQENRVLELTEITGSIKEIAKELQVPVIALAQLNREAEKRSGGEPRLMDLRESGSIENDADIIGLLYRRHYYTKADEDEGFGEIIIAKHRDGPPGRIKLKFDDETMRFLNLTKMWSNDPEQHQK